MDGLGHGPTAIFIDVIFFEVEIELEINTQSMLQTAEEMIQNQPTRSSKSCLRFRACQSSFEILE